MALPASGFSLDDVRIEIGLSLPTGLKACIAAAGKTGVWDRLSDFANYAHGTFEMSPTSLDFNDTGTPSQNITVTASGAWTCTKSSWVNASPLTGTGNDTIVVTCDLNAGAARIGDVTGDLDSNPTVADFVRIDQDGM